MNNRTLTLILAVVALASLSFAFYANSQRAKLENDATVWKDKYEEALIDMEEANKRLVEYEDKLKIALIESEKHRQQAEQALKDLEAKKKR
jgi:predicted PurR-regulated permease PerM